MLAASYVGSPMAEPLLPPALLSRLERLQLGSRRALAGLYAGEHRSPRSGSSLDFADYRDYHPGDDFRRIDYNLYARLNTLLIKLFDAEDELTVRLVLDTSASMGHGGKLRLAAQLAGALGFVGLTRRDAVTVTSFPGGRGATRFVGRAAAPQLFDQLAGLEATGNTPIAAVVGDLLARPGPRGLTVLLSDLMSPDWELALRRLPARGGAIAIVHVLDRSELDPTLVGDVTLIDSETSARVQVSLTADVVARYRREAWAWADEVAAAARHQGATYSRVFSDDDIETILTNSWLAGGLLR